MDLIDRQAAIDAIVSGTVYEDENAIKKTCSKPTAIQGWIGGMNDAIDAIKDVDAIPAVPLMPLCAWLAGYAIPPRYAMEAIGEPTITSADQRAKAWEHAFREMMDENA